MMDKCCTECHVAKPLSEFYKRSASSGGLNPKCIECIKSIKKCYYQKNRERVLSQCKESYQRRADKVKKYRREYYQNNTEKCKASSAAWSMANPERKKDNMRAWYEKQPPEYKKAKTEYSREWSRKNRDRRNATARAWRGANVERAREAGRLKENRRRARLAEVRTASFTAEQLEQRWEYYGNKCWMCGEEATCTDHVKPVSKGGCHMLCNLRPACKSCNSAKKDRWPYSPPGRDDIAAAAA